MGYCYSREGRLVCDECGADRGVRRRTCPRKVLEHSLRGPRVAVPYCSPPALCGPCYRLEGGARVVHAACKVMAAKAQSEADEIEAALNAGEMFAVCAYGDWKDTVPAGMAGVVFQGRAGRVWRLVDGHEYNAPANYRRRLSDFPGAVEWDTNAPATKQL